MASHYKQYKTFSMMGPGGVVMETMADNIRIAWNNLRYRLQKEFGMTRFQAAGYDHRDLHEVI